MISKIVLAIIAAIFLTGLKRKIVARMQGRIGPKIIQPFIDIAKLLQKESVVPRTASSIFSLIPAITLSCSITLLFFIPIFGDNAIIETDIILVLYMLSIPSILLVLAAIASNTNYSSIGAQREIIMLIGIEIPLIFIVLSASFLSNSFNVSMVKASFLGFENPISFFGVLLLIFTLIIALSSELKSLPFDMPEAGTEIGAGLLSEYSGTGLALFKIAIDIRNFSLISLLVYFMLPNIGLISSFILYTFLVLLLYIVSGIIPHAIFPRMRIDDFSNLFLKHVTLLSLISIVLIIGGKIWF